MKKKMDFKKNLIIHFFGLETMSGAPNYYSRNPDPRANYDQAPLNDLGKLENHFSDDEVKVDSKQILDTNISNVSFKNECMWSNCILEWLNLCFLSSF